jgi:cytochrome c-type biogenesis protein CcmH
MKKFLIALCCCLPLWGQAKEAEYANGDPVMHQRVMEISAELRCLVCQGQSLADSHADFAIDMRNQIQEMMEAGKSNREVIDFLVERYGDYIRYRPPFNATTALLWFGPFVLLLIGVGVLYFNVLQRKKQIKDQPLSEDEQRRAEALLQQDSGDKKA